MTSATCGENNIVGEAVSFPREGNAFPYSLRTCLILVLQLLFLTSCGGQHFHVPAEGPPSDAPHFVDLQQDKQVATMHFPAGTYSFYAVDDKGYYYRAPRGIVEHAAGSNRPHNGGLYLSKRDHKMRGYVYMAGGVTHLGNFSSKSYELRD